MPKLAVRSLPRSVAIALLLGAGSPPAIAGQAPPNFGGILGAILNSALTDQARREWQDRPIADYSCLEAHNLSAGRLAADGVSPNDPRVQRIFAQCADEAAIRARVAISPVVASHNHDFVVDGLAVGAAVRPDSPVYRAYKCRPSDEFPGFTWCAIKHPMSGRFGPYDSWVTILHSDTNIAVFILQDVTPAYFSPGDAEREIDSSFPVFRASRSRSYWRFPRGCASLSDRRLGRRDVNAARRINNGAYSREWRAPRFGLKPVKGETTV
jgi:hypothetical protein